MRNAPSPAARSWEEKVRVVSTTQRLLPPKVRKDVLETVSQALYADTWLDVSYVNAGGKRSDSKVMPLGLAQQGARMLLVCRFDGYDDERSLSLHRIHSASDRGLPFKRPESFKLRLYDHEGHFGSSTGKPIRLVFRLSRLAGVHLTESPLSEDQTVTESASGYEFTATVIESEQLKWWLRGFGRQLRLLSPADLLPR